MGSYIDPSFRESLLKKPQDRTSQVINLGDFKKMKRKISKNILKIKFQKILSDFYESL